MSISLKELQHIPLWNKKEMLCEWKQYILSEQETPLWMKTIYLLWTGNLLYEWKQYTPWELNNKLLCEWQ